MPFIKAITMIILNSTNVNTNFENNLNSYKNILNFTCLECPCCHSKEYIKWGFYERGVTYMKNGRIHSETVSIQRILCKSCNKTHAILPLGIVPYKQLTDEILISLLLDETIVEYFSDDMIRYYKKQFLKCHFSYLSTLLKVHDYKKILCLIQKKKKNILSQYIRRHNRCFMQIKLGVLGFCSFCEATPT